MKSHTAPYASQTTPAATATAAATLDACEKRENYKQLLNARDYCCSVSAVLLLKTNLVLHIDSLVLCGFVVGVDIRSGLTGRDVSFGWTLYRGLNRVYHRLRWFGFRIHTAHATHTPPTLACCAHPTYSPTVDWPVGLFYIAYILPITFLPLCRSAPACSVRRYSFFCWALRCCGLRDAVAAPRHPRGGFSCDVWFCDSVLAADVGSDNLSVAGFVWLVRAGQRTATSITRTRSFLLCVLRFVMPL